MNATVTMDIGIIDWIESVLCLDCAPPRDVIEALHERVEAHHDAWSDPDLDGQLVEDTRKALDGGWLRLDEIRSIQRLRGWHRVSYGNVTVSRDRLAEVARVLNGLLTHALDSECDDTLKEYGLHRVDGPPRHAVPDRYWAPYAKGRADVLKLMTKQGMCGECTWCQVFRLRDQCEAILDAAKAPQRAVRRLELKENWL